ncbi:unnamed protein product [Parajaminaea phylloscopi]
MASDSVNATSTPARRPRKRGKLVAPKAPTDESGADSEIVEKKETPTRKQPVPWTSEEDFGMWKAIYVLALNNVTSIRGTPELAARSSANVNMRMRGVFKKHAKALGEDPKYIDQIKIVSKRKEREDSEGESA